MLATWLRRLVGKNLAENILGDLEEQSHRRPPSRVRRGLWITGQLLCVIGAVLAQRGRDASATAPRIRLRPFGFWTELRFALRSLGRAPWYTTTVVGVLALSTALAASVFAVVDGVLLKPLPYPRVHQVVSLDPGWQSDGTAGLTIGASTSDVVAWMQAIPEVPLAFFQLGSREQLDDGEAVRGAEVSSAFLDVIGKRALIGGFLPEHFAERRPIRPALLTFGCWQRRFAADPAVLGRVVQGDRGRAIEVVGVLPKDFLFPSDLGRFVPEVLTPLVLGPNAATSRSRGLDVIARLPASISGRSLESRLAIAATDVARRFPLQPGQGGRGPFDVVRVTEIDEALRSGSRHSFTLVFTLALGLVFVACLNVTGLAAARAQDRRRELTLRRSLGAGGGDLVRLLAIENGAVVVLSTIVGVVASWYFVPIVGAFLPDDLVLLKPLAIDWRVGAFAAALAALVVMVTTIWPARVILERDPGRRLGSATRVARHRRAGRLILLGSQVALALVMSLGGALLAGSLMRVWREDPGYRVDGTLTLSLSSRSATSWTEIDALLGDLRRLPGVTAAGGFNVWLLQRALLGSRGFEAPHDASDSAGEGVGVTDGFFEATGLRPIAGRWPTNRELASGAKVVAVSAQVARTYWRNEPAVGQMLLRRGEPFVVVGVVPDARYLALDGDPIGAVYYPLAADARPELVDLFIAYERGDLQDMAAVLALIADRHPIYRVRSAQTVAATLAASIGQRTFHTLLFASFGLAAVVIVAVGVLGLAAIVTSRRTREIGVRLALGAQRSGIVNLVLRQELAGVAIGLAGGAVVALGLVRFVDSYMYKASVYDPLAWLTATGLLLSAATIGVLIPALRASRTDPVNALRVE